MSLPKPKPGLRAPVRLRHNANSPQRVEVIVPALDELEVSPEVAAQLQAANSHFQRVEATAPDTAPDSTPGGNSAAPDSAPDQTSTEVPAAADTKADKKPAKKAAAKPADPA
ncbi:hypothetical protein [Catellatospora sp. NPDC049609]|uniref:hypothetical protein n=1 Tax=Catellatospora sp. NPDC049609 TaxID=3155505 RepID=UPI0034214CE7